MYSASSKLVFPVLGILAVWVVLNLPNLFKYLSTERQRKKSLAGLAAAMGLGSPGKDRTLAQRYSNSVIWKRWAKLGPNNVLTGPVPEGRLTSFEVIANESVGQLSVCAIDTDIHCEPLLIESKSSAGVNDWTPLGMSRVALDSSEFSSAFQVRSANRKLAFDVLHSRTMEFLLARPALSINMRDDYTIVWCTRLPVTGVESMIEDTREFVRLLPAYLRSDLATQAAAIEAREPVAH